jgi:WD40 repeat protein
MRFVRAWRVPLLVAALGGLAIVLALAVGWQRTRFQRDRALQAENEASSQRRQADVNLARALVERAQDALRSDQRAEAEVLAAHALTLEPSPEALGVLAGFARAPRPRQVSSSTPPPCVWADLRAGRLLCGEEASVSLWDLQPLALRWRRMVAATEGEQDVGSGQVFLRLLNDVLQGFDAETGEPDSAALLPADEYRVRAAGRARPTGPEELLSAVHERRRRNLDGHPCTGFQRPLAFSPTTSTFAGLCADGTLWGGAPEDREVPVHATPFRDEAEASQLAWTPDGRGLVLGTIRGQVALLDARTGDVLADSESDLGLIRQIRVSDEGMAAVMGSRGEVRVWSPQAGAWVLTLPGSGARSVDWDGDELLVLGATLQRWTLPALPVPVCLHTHDGVAALASSPDGRLLAIAQGGGWLRVTSLPDGVPVLARRVDPGVVKSVSFSPDGRFLASAAAGGPQTLRWQVGTWAETRLEGNPRLRRIGWLGSWTIGLSMGQGVFRWPISGPRGGYAMDTRFVDMAGSPGGEALALLDLRGGVWVQRRAEQLPRLVTSLPRAVAVDLSADGETVVVASEDRVALLDGQGRARLEIQAPKAEIRTVALSPDGRTVVAGGLDKRARVWSTADGALLLVLAGHADRVSALAYGPDSRWLVTGSWDRTVRIWDLGVLDQEPAQVAAEVGAAWRLVLTDLLGGNP